MNSGVNLRRAASTPLFSILPSSSMLRSLVASYLACTALKPSLGLMRADISAAPRLLVMKIMAREKSTRRLSPSVSVALSRMPSSRFHSASLAFSISSNSTKLSLHLLGVILVQHFLAEQGMRLAMPQISGRRADQLGDLVAVLELGAVDLDHRARIPQQASAVASTMRVLPGAGRTEEQEVADRAARGAHSRQVHLVDVDDLLDRLILTDDKSLQTGFEAFGIFSGSCRIERFLNRDHFHHSLTATTFCRASKLPIRKMINGRVSHRAHYLGGLEGRTSTRLMSVRCGMLRMPMTISAISSGAIFQEAPAVLRPNSVFTLPGMM